MVIHWPSGLRAHSVAIESSERLRASTSSMKNATGSASCTAAAIGRRVCSNTCRVRTGVQRHSGMRFTLVAKRAGCARVVNTTTATIDQLVESCGALLLRTTPTAGKAHQVRPQQREQGVLRWSIPTRGSQLRHATIQGMANMVRIHQPSSTTLQAASCCTTLCMLRAV